MRSTKQGFTLVELMVVLGMIGMIMAALTSSVMGAQKRAQIAKAESEVKVITQAILAAENWSKGGEFKLPTYQSPVDADASTLQFLLGKESADSGGQIPVMLMAQLQSGGKLLDPWGHPYKLTIREGNAAVSWSSGDIQTGYQMPNYYRLGAGERHVEER